jgi:hypothetical protein
MCMWLWHVHAAVQLQQHSAYNKDLAKLRYDADGQVHLADKNFGYMNKVSLDKIHWMTRRTCV